MAEATTLSSVIKKQNEGIRLIDFLCSRFKYHKREDWEKLIGDGSLRVNTNASSPGYILKNKDIVTYSVVLHEPPVDSNIRIIHDEDAFLVAFKPGNLPSHADGNFIKNTFIYLLKNMIACQGYHGPVKLVHRLDRETSGIILAAKQKESHNILIHQFEAGTVEKEYIAISRGIIQKNSLIVNGAISMDIKSKISIRRRVVPDGTPGSLTAVTRFEVIERLNDYTLLRCLPATGRTNQIRVHLDHIGHPLAGDKLYGRSDEQFLEFVRNARNGIYKPLSWMDANRHMLHASKLAFLHPVTGKRVSFQSPVPEDMLCFIEKAR